MSEEFERVMIEALGYMDPIEAIYLADKTRKLYKNLPVHNSQHGFWVADKAIHIANILEEDVRYKVLISMALLHDVGAHEYARHPELGAEIAQRELPRFMELTADELELIAQGIREHDGQIHTFPESQILYDADTLNKAGSHGIQQCHLAAVEFGLDAQQMVDRWVPGFRKKIEKGYYSNRARELDRQAGNGVVGGLEMTYQHMENLANLLNPKRTS
ncbi:MAG: HD domain-containing protein [Candidatus Woesearchaeota archaeon]